MGEVPVGYPLYSTFFIVLFTVYHIHRLLYFLLCYSPSIIYSFVLFTVYCIPCCVLITVYYKLTN